MGGDPREFPEEAAIRRHPVPGRIVLVLQGGGALGAFQAGVYEAMHEAGIEPDWVVGTSIGAINGAIIAGNRPADRLPNLRRFWDLIARGAEVQPYLSTFGPGSLLVHLGILFQGIPGFFQPNQLAWLGPLTPLGVAAASFYTTAPLRATLSKLADLHCLGETGVRLTLGAVNARTGQMRYFDSQDVRLSLDHVMASGALPPAFPAVVIDGEPYWDGGIYSNTPIEVVMDEVKRRSSVIFAAQLWQQDDEDPDSIERVVSRLKDIVYSSRHCNHVARQQQIHHLRHVVRELGKLLPEEQRAEPRVKELIDWGCATIMHILSLRAPRLEGDDFTKDIDFSPEHVRARWQAGRDLTRRKIEEAPWNDEFDPVMGIVMHE